MNVLWINQEVTLPLTKSEIDKQVEAAEIMGRVCYKSEPKGDPIAFLSRIINRGHESVIEHINIPAVLSTDRAVTHQLVRHRHGSFCLAGDTKVRTYRGWRHIFRMRLDGAAQPQIRALLLALRQRMELKYDLAWAFKDIPVDTNRLHSVPEL